MKIPETKYLIAGAIVVLLVLLYFYWKYKKAEKVTDKKTKRKTRTKNKKASKPAKRPSSDSEDEPDQDEPDDEDQDSAQALYNLVHDRMSSGMQSDEFIEVVGDDYDNLTYIEIKQLYNDAKNKGQDPSTSVSIDDYAVVLSKRASSD